MTESEAINKLPILDRIRKAEIFLGVSRREIAEEITRLVDNNDIKGMQNLYFAYENWEQKGRKAGVSKEQIEELAKRNFDIVAQIADGFRIGRDAFSAMAYTNNSDKRPPGKITSFYRKAIVFNPSMDNSINN